MRRQNVLKSKFLTLISYSLFISISGYSFVRDKHMSTIHVGMFLPKTAQYICNLGRHFGGWARAEFQPCYTTVEVALERRLHLSVGGVRDSTLAIQFS